MDARQTIRSEARVDTGRRKARRAGCGCPFVAGPGRACVRLRFRPAEHDDRRTGTAEKPCRPVGPAAPTLLHADGHEVRRVGLECGRRLRRTCSTGDVGDRPDSGDLMGNARAGVRPVVVDQHAAHRDR